MRALTLALVTTLATLSGCSSDPCDGKSGTCISARVEGAIPSLTQLRINVDGLGAKSSPDPAGSAFSLPVKVAIVLPPTATSPARVTIEALDGARVVGSSATVAVTFTPGQKQSQTFTLSPGAGPDLGGGTDDMGPGDMQPPPGQISLSATMFTFPATERGKISSPQMLRVTNRTSMEQTITVADVDANFGMGEDFDVKFDQTCQDQALMGIRIAAGGNCDGMITFKPGAGGTRRAMIPLVASNGQTFTLMFQGQGLRGWTSITIPGGPSLEAVSGFVNPLEFIVVGHDFSGTPIWIYDERNGTWARDPAQRMPSKNLFSVETVDDGTSRRLYVGGDDNTLYLSTDGADFVSFPAPFTGSSVFLRSIAVNQSKTKLYVSTDNGTWARFDIALKTWDGPYAWPTKLVRFVSGTQGVEVLGVGFSSVAALYSPTDTAPGEISGGPIGPLMGMTNAWMGADGSNRPRVWGVGDPRNILVWPNTGMMPMAESFMNSALMNPRAIAGRWNGNANDFDLYIVGAFGPVIAKRGQNGVWGDISVPGGNARTAIWVSPAGDVATVGFNSETTLFY